MLAVARSLLADSGPTGLTYTELSARSSVTRQTLYRHWPAPESLLVELVLTAPDVAYPEPGTDVVDVVTEFLVSLRNGISDATTSTALLSLAAHAATDPTSANALAAITADRCAALNILLAGTSRHVDPTDFARLVGPVIFQCLLARTTPTDAFLHDIATEWTRAGAV